jgi:hypothetical protein
VNFVFGEKIMTMQEKIESILELLKSLYKDPQNVDDILDRLHPDDQDGIIIYSVSDIQEAINITTKNLIECIVIEMESIGLVQSKINQFAREEENTSDLPTR